MLKDLTMIWGIDVSALKSYGRRSKVVLIVLYAVDIIIVTSMVAYMYNKGVTFWQYFILLVLTCASFALVHGLVINFSKWDTYKFYVRHKNFSVDTFICDFSSDILYSIMYCSKCRRIPDSSKSVETLVEQMLGYCREDAIYARRFVDLMEKYKSEAGKYEVTYCKLGKKRFLVDINILEEDKENEYDDFAGTAE